MLLISSLTFSATLDVPESIDKEITKSARNFDGSQRVSYINWQKRAYIQMEEIFKDSGIPQSEVEKIMTKLHKMYGSNYAKQLQVLPDEINDYREVVRRVQQETSNLQKVDETINQQAKQEVEKTLNSSEIPTRILDIYKTSAEELFPNNYPKQKEYLDISIRDYQKILDIIKEEM